MPTTHPVADIGLELSAGSITIARWQKGLLQVVVTREVTLPESEADARQVVIAELTKLVEEHGLAGRDAAIAVGGEILLSSVTLPPMPEKEFRHAVELELHDSLGLDLAELESDVIRLRTTKDSEGLEQVEALASTLTRSRAHALAVIVQEAGLVPVILMPSVQALAHLVHQATDMPPGTVLWIDVGYAAITLGVFCDRRLLAVDELSVGYRSILQQLTKPIQDKEGAIVQLTDAEARQLVAERGVPTELTEERWLGKITPLLFMIAMRPQLDRLVNEVKRTIGYVASKFPEHPITSVIMSGWGAGIPHLDQFLAEQLGVGCILASGLKLARTAPVLHTLPSALNAGYVAAGASAATKGQGLNLLPLEFRTKKLERYQVVSLRLASVLALGLLAISFLFLSLQVKLLEREFGTKQSHLAKLAQVTQLHARVRAREELFQWITSTEIPITEIMQEVSLGIPKEVWLSSMALDRSSKQVSLQGAVFASPDQPAELPLSKFLGALEESPFFAKVSLNSVQRDQQNLYRSPFQARAEAATP